MDDTLSTIGVIAKCGLSAKLKDTVISMTCRYGVSDEGGS